MPPVGTVSGYTFAPRDAYKVGEPRYHNCAIKWFPIHSTVTDDGCSAENIAHGSCYCFYSTSLGFLSPRRPGESYGLAGLDVLDRHVDVGNEPNRGTLHAPLHNQESLLATGIAIASKDCCEWMEALNGLLIGDLFPVTDPYPLTG